MLLYSLLHIAGFDLPMSELKRFRQMGSKTPGHPEYGHTVGVEATTGPLGQGFANAVGMAISSKMMAARFNSNETTLIDHKVWAIVSDGDLMEGVTSEAASVAGHLGLDNLIFIYDDNHISIDGDTKNTFTEDVKKRFEAYGWHVEKIDGHDPEQIIVSIERALAIKGQPSLIMARTHIGFGSPAKQDTAKSHGEPLGREEVLATKKALQWPTDEEFHVPEAVYEFFKHRNADLAKRYEAWENTYREWRGKHPELAHLWDQYWEKSGPDLYRTLSRDLPEMPEATRNISAKIQGKVAVSFSSLVAGSADLAGSTKAIIPGAAFIEKTSFEGRNIHFGVREHAMGALANGMALYGSFVPVTSTFLVFSDYMRPAIRVAALSGLQNIFVFTHDSIFLGEDGPTHQPIEHLGSLRLIPNLHVIRPATSLECLAAWQMAMDRKHGPTAIILTRQKLPKLESDHSLGDGPLHGGYIFKEASKRVPDLLLVATGSELPLAIEAGTLLERDGIATRVVSMPCLERFYQQAETYQRSVVLQPEVPTVVIEAANCDPWYKLQKHKILTLGMDRFGASAPDVELAKQFGFTPDAVYQKILGWLGAS